MRDAKYLREQAQLSLEIARQLSDPAAAARVRLSAAALLALAEEIEQQTGTAATPQIQTEDKKHWTQNNDQGGAPMARSSMARSSTARWSNPDQDFGAGYEKIEPELENWRGIPPLSLDDLFRNPAVQERVGKLIARALRRSVCP